MGGGEQQQQQHVTAPNHQILLVFPTFSRASASSSRIPVILGNGGGSTPGQTRRTSCAIPWERWERSVKAWISCLNSTFIYPSTLDVFKIVKYASIIHVN